MTTVVLRSNYILYLFLLPQVFPTISKSQSKPEPTSQSKTSKAPLSLFDDEEEEVNTVN